MGTLSIARKLALRSLSLAFPLVIVLCCYENQPIEARTYANLNSSTVVQIQKNLIKLGYLSGSADGVFGKKTLSALLSFQQNSGLKPDGIYGSKTRTAITAAVGTIGPSRYTVSKGDSLWLISRRFKTTPEALSKANNIPLSMSLKVGQSLIIPSGRLSASRGIISGTRVTGAMSWGSVNGIFKVKSWARVTDVRSGCSFQVIRKGGSLHADVEPATQADSNTLKTIYGGRWSWDRRAVIVNISGSLVAGSMNGMPHGVSNVKNNGFPGHFCIHFLGSRIHRTGAVDAKHQAMVRYASEHMR